MPAGSASTSLSITNPLVLYRALIATKRIKPDPAQHRLALQLQKLYYRLKDYSPELEYRQRLDQISRSIPRSNNVAQQRHRSQQDAATDPDAAPPPPPPSTGFLSSFFKNMPNTTMLALTRTTPIHDSALNIDSPHGMLLYGEVGRGKSMLLDLLYSSLPSIKKRRWHFNTFMLDIFRRLEQARIERAGMLDIEHEHVVLSLAKDTVNTSPILFLDEFQLPDRTSSKLVNSFMTAFFHLGGVLVASSNRMPDELAKASGIELRGAKRQSGGKGLFGWSLARTNEGEKAAQSDFGKFLEILKARCEVWEMEGERDWRREDELMGANSAVDGIDDVELILDEKDIGFVPVVTNSSFITDATECLSSDSPPHYHVTLTSNPTSSSGLSTDLLSLNPSQTWIPTTLNVYGRTIHIPTSTSRGVAKCTFSSLCATNLGPADYNSIAAKFHTLILTDVPVLTLREKNEARRFITLLDALYEAKCRLCIEAAAPPDKLFFPETRTRIGSTNTSSSISTTKTLSQSNNTTIQDELDDSIASESFSEIYLDTTAPFRPNISSYNLSSSSSLSSPLSSQNSFTNSLLNPNLRSVLADEDADFGPTYGNGRSAGASTLDSGPAGMAELELRQGPQLDFTDTSALTGEDEKFAYKRARSRLWEMCGGRWWREREGFDLDTTQNGQEIGWEAGTGERSWTPLPREARFWEKVEELASLHPDAFVNTGTGSGVDPTVSTTKEPTAKESSLFRHGASPFRTMADPPPKFGWQHAWGMMKWGKKAGEWGKGTEAERITRREREREAEPGDEREQEGGDDGRKQEKKQS